MSRIPCVPRAFSGVKVYATKSGQSDGVLSPCLLSRHLPSFFSCLKCRFDVWKESNHPPLTLPPQRQHVKKQQKGISLYSWWILSSCINSDLPTFDFLITKGNKLLTLLSHFFLRYSVTDPNRTPLSELAVLKGWEDHKRERKERWDTIHENLWLE